MVRAASADRQDNPAPNGHRTSEIAMLTSRDQ